jgi:peptide/nickel transport system substrate-binding protein
MRNRFFPLIVLVVLAAGSCNRAPMPTQITIRESVTRPVTTKPSTPTSMITFTPTIAASATPDGTATFTPLPDDAIVLNFGFADIPDEQEYLMDISNWTQQISAASGLNVIAVQGPTTDMEILQGKRDGRIDMALLMSLNYAYAHELGWVEPGLAAEIRGQDAYSFMFISRKDSGLIPGELPDVLTQLAGRHPCWPDPEELHLAPEREYILPLGLLAQAGVELGEPVFIPRTPAGLNEVSAVFRGECDFAAMDSMYAEGFSNMLTDDLNKSGVTYEEWADQMQILYITPPIMPWTLLAFSANLDMATRQKLAEAVQGLLPPFEYVKWLPFDERQVELYDNYENLIMASGFDVASYLSKSWVLAYYDIDAKPTSTPGSVAEALVIDVRLNSGGQPWLPFGDTSYEPLNRLVLPSIYAELARLDASGNYFPYLAKELPTLQNGLMRFVGDGEDEYLEVEFQLRPGLTWQDGQPLTAEDLVFSWELVMQPGWPGYQSGNTGSAAEIYVSSVEALGDDRVVYRLMSQREARQAAQDGGRLGDAALYDSLADQEGPVVPLDILEVGRNVFPQHLLADIPVSRIATSDFASRPVYAGAYRLVEGGGDDQSVGLEAFAGFVLVAPPIQRVIFGTIYADPGASTYWQTPEELAVSLPEGTVQAQLGLSAVQIREGADPRLYDALAEQGLASVTWSPRYGWATFDFNLDNPHLADLKVRQVIAHAIDRQAIIDLALYGHGSLMRSYLPSWDPRYAGDEALPDYDYDPEEARRLLQEAGYDLGQFPAMHPTRGALALRLDSMDVASYPRTGTAALIQEELKAIGIEVQVQFHEWLEFEAEDCSGIRNSRQFDLGMAGWVGGSRFGTWYPEHVTASWSIPTEENGCAFDYANWTGWNNPRVDEIIPLLQDGRLALEHPEEYQALWIEHQQLWANELPSLPLFNWHRPVVTAPGLQGVQPSLFAFDGVEDTWNIFAWVFDLGN